MRRHNIHGHDTKHGMFLFSVLLAAFSAEEKKHTRRNRNKENNTIARKEINCNNDECRILSCTVVVVVVFTLSFWATLETIRARCFFFIRLFAQVIFITYDFYTHTYRFWGLNLRIM